MKQQSPELSRSLNGLSRLLIGAGIKLSQLVGPLALTLSPDLFARTFDGAISGLIAEVAVSRTTGIQSRLAISQQSTLVEVVASTATLETTASPFSKVVDSRQVRNTPLSGHNDLQMPRHSPSASSAGSGSLQRHSVNGSRIAGRTSRGNGLLIALAGAAAFQGEDDNSRGRSLHENGHDLRQQGRYDEALDSYAKSLAMFEKAGDPPRVAQTLHSWAALLLALGSTEPALALLLRASRIADLPPITEALVFCHLGEAQYRIRDHRAAAYSLGRARSAHRRIAGARNPSDLRPALFHGDSEQHLLALIANNQGLVAYEARNFRQAENFWKESIALYRTAPGAATAALGSPLANLADLLRIIKRFEESRQHFAEALEILESLNGPETSPVADTLNLLGSSLFEAGEFPQCRLVWERALRISEKTGGPDHDRTGAILVNLAQLDAQEGFTAKSAERFERSLRILEAAAGPENPVLIPALRGYATLLRKIDRNAEAKTLTSRLKAIEAFQGKLKGSVSLDELRSATKFANRRDDRRRRPSVP